MNDKLRFSQYGQKLRKSFPTWTKIRKDPDAIGSQFLSVIGLQLDDIQWLLNYAYQQTYIGSADVNHVDVIYKARIPNNLRPDMNYRFSSSSHILHPMDSEVEFLKSMSSMSEHQSIQYDTAYYLDFDNKYIYVKQPYNGQIILTIINENGEEIWTEAFPLLLHHVWNFFDEFGLLLGVPRLYGERNYEYKERILDVFRRPSSSTYDGLKNGIARELGLVHQVLWNDDSAPLVLHHPRVDHGSITVNGDPVPPEYVTVDESHRTVILYSGAESQGPHVVRYIAGVNLHELHDKADTAFQKKLYRAEGSATTLLKAYVENIQNHVPIMWGQWRWNQGFWNIADENMSGFGFLPVMYDGRFTGWKTYKPKEG